MGKWFSFVLFFFFSPFISHSQKQLIVLKQEKVLLRLYPGDEIVFSVKGSKTVRRSYINNLYDTAVVAHTDVIPFHRIDKIYFVRRNLLNVLGGLLLIGGAGYFVIDQVNYAIVQGHGVDINENVVITSVAMIGTGLPLMMLKRKYARIRGKYRILMADKGSGFYLPDSRQEITD